MPSFLSRLGNLAANISPVGRMVRGGVNAARSLRRGDIGGAARAYGGAVLGNVSPLAGQAMRARAQLGAVTGGIKSGMPGQPMMGPQKKPMMGEDQMPPPGMGGQMAQVAPDMGQDVENARRQFMLSRIQRNPNGGFNPGGY